MTPARPEAGERVIRTVCPLGCGIGCGILAHVKDGVLTRVEPGDFAGTSHICARGLSAPKLVYHPDRLKYPMKRKGARGEGQWERISWDEALDLIAANIREIGRKYGPNSFAFVTTGVGVFGNLLPVGFSGAVQGTFILPAGAGDSAGPCADQICYGSLWWFGEDYPNRFSHPAFCLVWGNNPAQTEPFKWKRIRRAKDTGAKLVVIDPRFTTTAAKADHYIRIRPGTDAALALGMMNVILGRQLHDTSFITSRTSGPFLVRSDNGLYLKEKDVSPGGPDDYMVWDSLSHKPQSCNVPSARGALTGTYHVNGVECRPAFQLLSDLAAQYSPARASEITGVPADIIARLAAEYAAAKPAAIYRGLGGTRGSIHGDLSFRAMNTLAAITGNISFEDHAPHQYNQALFLTHGFPGFVTLLQAYEAVAVGKPYPIRALWMNRRNTLNQDPNFNYIIRDLLPRLEFIVATDMFMTTSTRYADVVLPVSSSFEYCDLVAPIGNGSHSYLQVQEKVIEPLHESKSYLDMFAALARKMNIEGFLDKSAEDYIRVMLASGHPSMDGITLERLRENPMPPAPHELPDFGTPSKRFEFYSERLKPFGEELPVYREPMENRSAGLSARYPLSLLSAHPKYRLHSMFANVSWIREFDPGPALDINPADARERGIRDGDLVRVFNDRGEMKLKASVHEGVMQGVVNVSQGWSPGDYAGGFHQALTHNVINPAQAAVYEPNAAYYDVAVQAERVQEG